ASTPSTPVSTPASPASSCCAPRAGRNAPPALAGGRRRPALRSAPPPHAPAPSLRSASPTCPPRIGQEPSPDPARPVGGGKFTGRHEGRKDLRCSGPCLFWSFLCFSVPSCEFSGDSSARSGERGPRPGPSQNRCL